MIYLLPNGGVFVASYLLGSIPFGLLLTKSAGLGDIRSIGSGNIGATNVLRTGNKKLAAATLLLDGLKGVAAVVLANLFCPSYAAFCGLLALLGHLFPVWLKFKGGKGVATTIGVLAALNWPTGLIMAVIWLLVARLSRISSLSALFAIGVTPFLNYLLGHHELVWINLIIVLLVFWKHDANIRRLVSGTEPEISISSKLVPPREDGKV